MVEHMLFLTDWCLYRALYSLVKTFLSDTDHLWNFERSEITLICLEISTLLDLWVDKR